MSEIAAIKKQLKIKSSVVQRYEKEIKYYQQEAGDLQQKLDKFISEQAEEWDLKNTTRMIEESKKMIVDTETRLGKASGELSDLIGQVKGKPDVADTEEFKKAADIAEEIAKRAESSFA
ncbi:hypothetical protein NP233_g3669 [Leucocoprinus birnbaumii]|uniref:Tubulin-specific chaperone A n=1 Tax=Leucocoprinus birnbaumii TaxID=56174 RepID=A0AAD5YSL6_9AGAR|nr:hypothetical protein NP233_g3669 [Leucocoprinus birnbaumii]